MKALHSKNNFESRIVIVVKKFLVNIDLTFSTTMWGNLKKNYIMLEIYVVIRSIHYAHDNVA